MRLKDLPDGSRFKVSNEEGDIVHYGERADNHVYVWEARLPRDKQQESHWPIDHAQEGFNDAGYTISPLGNR